MVGYGQRRGFAAVLEVRVRGGRDHRGQLHELFPVPFRDAQDRACHQCGEEQRPLGQVESPAVESWLEEAHDRLTDRALPGGDSPSGEPRADRPAHLGVPGRISGRHQPAGRDIVLSEMGHHRAALRRELPVVAEHAADVGVARHRPELPAVRQDLVVQGCLRPHHVPDRVRIARGVEIEVEQVDAA